MSYREAALATGCGDFADLYTAAKPYGLTELHRERARCVNATRSASELSALDR
jgi:hypothetical protein